MSRRRSQMLTTDHRLTSDYSNNSFLLDGAYRSPESPSLPIVLFDIMGITFSVIRNNYITLSNYQLASMPPKSCPILPTLPPSYLLQIELKHNIAETTQ